MGFYQRVIFPRLCNWVLNTPAIAHERRVLLRYASGKILEIGFGTGLNLDCYPPEVRKLIIIEPNAGMHQMAQRNIQKSGIEVESHQLQSEKLPFPDDCFDTVVSTFTLCSIADVLQTMHEIYRVLKPSGKFLFLEHGLSRNNNVQKWQRRLNCLQGKLGDGCQLTRDMRSIVTSQPFASLELEEYYLKHSPRTHGYLYRGRATK